jgi:hypothetical protein
VLVKFGDCFIKVLEKFPDCTRAAVRVSDDIGVRMAGWGEVRRTESVYGMTLSDVAMTLSDATARLTPLSYAEP